MKLNFVHPASQNLSKAVNGFSLMEVLATVAIAGTLVGVAVPVVQNATTDAKQVKLREDVATLNTAVKAYLASGGTIAADAEASAVLPKLKTVASAGVAKRLVGLGRTFIDPRLSGKVTKQDGRSRAVWNAATQRFDIAAKGTGFEAFTLDAADATAPAAEEARQTAQLFSEKDGWVWDNNDADTGATRELPTTIALASVAPEVLEAQQVSKKPMLQQPTVSLAPGLYPYSDFPLDLTLTNPNPAGTSMLYYSINGNGWQAYATGSTIKVPKDMLNSTVETYAAPLNGDNYADSQSANNLYQTIFFKGTTAGVFSGPSGDAGLVTNLGGGKTGSLFTWGNPVDSKKGPNWLQFAPAGSFWVLPEQEFKIGDISYYNGTTYSGTNATAVKMDVTLNLSVPMVTEKLNFTLKLQSTVNKGLNADADADYVWIPTLSSQFKTTVQGQTFYLQLRFGTVTTNGFTTIDEFHVHEDKTATGAVYGKLTTTPQA